MWNPEHRRAALRNGLRYPNDVTDEEWALIGPLIPPAKRGGRRRGIDVREVLNAIFYPAIRSPAGRVWTGCGSRNTCFDRTLSGRQRTAHHRHAIQSASRICAAGGSRQTCCGSDRHHFGWRVGRKGANGAVA